jgi:predicted nucleic acid-binding OB-fold protein
MSPDGTEERFEKQPKKGNEAYEEYAFILDFSGNHLRAQVIGESCFRLLEVMLKTPNNADLKIRDRVYVGVGKRDSVTRVQGRLSGTKLTKKAEKEAKGIIQQSILTAFKCGEGELYRKFLLFFNHAAPNSLRRIGLSRREANTLVDARDRMLEQGRRFTDISDIEQEFRLAGIRTDRFGLADKVTGRVNMELMLPKKGYDKERLLLKFLANPRKSILDSHAVI